VTGPTDLDRIASARARRTRLAEALRLEEEALNQEAYAEAAYFIGMARIALIEMGFVETEGSGGED